MKHKILRYDLDASIQPRQALFEGLKRKKGV